LLAPVFLDELLFSQLHNASKRGYDVWVLPCSKTKSVLVPVGPNASLCVGGWTGTCLVCKFLEHS
jgi:hypothetical protein